MQNGNDSKYSMKYVVPAEKQPLAGENVLFLGSSVTFGSGSGEEAMPEYFAARFGMKVTKEAVSGTTLVDKDEMSYVSRLYQNVDPAIPYKLLVCQLSTNDAAQALPLGEIASQGAPFDTMTITGAMEAIIAYAKEKWNCPVVFYTGAYFDSEQYEAMVKRLYELSEKWGVGVLDLWNDADWNAVSEEERAFYMNDPVHPTKAGYLKWWCPELERQLVNYLKKL